ncbi:MAG: hypothetical protein QF411_11125 [Planctomycetota bacterium]|nr:hypothetical protein [Planctomycetota bacterium]
MIHTNHLIIPIVLGLAPSFPLSAAAAANCQEEAQSSPHELLERGRRDLERGNPDKALALFEEADILSGGDFSTRFWVLRCWIALGRFNDALDAVERLVTNGVGGERIDYLFGMALHGKGAAYLDQGVRDNSVGMAFNDALGYLLSATEAAPDEFPDAWAPLAEAAWYSQDLVVAREAAEKAVSLKKRDAKAAYVLGRVALSQFVAVKDNSARAEQAAAHHKRARQAFESGIALLRKPKEAADMTLLAKLQARLGDTLLWKQATVDAGKAYGAAMGWDPTAVDYGQLWGSLGAEGLLAALEIGAEAFTKNHGSESKADATLLWWLGYGRFSAVDYAGAEEAFTSCVAKWPDYVNSWFYIGMSRYHQTKYLEAGEAFAQNWDADPNDLVASIDSNRETNTAIFQYVIGQLAAKQKFVYAAKLSEALAGSQPDDWRFPNNAGLFWRNQGEVLLRGLGRSAKTKAKAAEFFELALVQYEAALALDPQHPNLLNDTGVILHYGLAREDERALDLYRQAIKYAEERLGRDGLTTEEKDLYQTALRDGKNNLKKLENGERRNG